MMTRSFVTSSILSALVLVACGGSDAIVGKTNAQKLQTTKDGGSTGNGTTCSWANTALYDQYGNAAVVPGYALGDEFKSIDGCNQCTCTGQGIMCTILSCSSTPPVACPALARLCNDGSAPKQGPNCAQICPEDGTVIACTDDAKKCPDGSFVPRVAPSCDFAACPSGGTVCGAPSKQCPDGTVISPGPNCEYPSCPNGGTVCTADAKKCADGSFVTRTGPGCTFAPCPGDDPATGKPCSAPECGVAPGMPNTKCADGSIAGPVCERSGTTATCGWVIKSCP